MAYKNYYTGEFFIRMIDYEKISRDFNIYKAIINSRALDPKKYGESNAKLFKVVRKLEHAKSYYYYPSKGEVYILGDKEFHLEKHELNNYLQSIPYNMSELAEDLEDMDKAILLKLLSRQIPYSVMEEKEPDDQRISFAKVNGLYFYLDHNKAQNFYRFIEAVIGKEKRTGRYEIALHQVTFTKLHDQKNRKYNERVSCDPVTKLMVPDENGEYMKFSSKGHKKEVGTRFIVSKDEVIKKMRSYYLTLLIDAFEEYLHEYIELEFIGLENYKRYTPKSSARHFENSLLKNSRRINIYRTKDRFLGESRKRSVKKEKAIEMKKQLESLSNNEIIDMGTCSADENIENDYWNIFLLNTQNPNELEIDVYNEIKKRGNLISNGAAVETLEGKASKTALKRVLDELLIKECIKDRNIRKIFSESEKLEGMGCIYIDKEKIREVKILSEGNIEIDIQERISENPLSKRVREILKKFDLEKSLTKKETIRIVLLENKEIVIQETELRPYFNTSSYRKKYREGQKQGRKTMARGKDGFLKHTMGIWLNYEEQTYYSLYSKGINSEIKLSPNIKRLLSSEKLTKEEMETIAETLNFIYHSNPSKLGTYPFIFKIASEV